MTRLLHSNTQQLLHLYDNTFFSQCQGVFDIFPESGGSMPAADVGETFWWRRGITIDYQVIEHMENVAISGDVPGMATFVYAVFTRMVLLLIQELILQI